MRSAAHLHLVPKPEPARVDWAALAVGLLIYVGAIVAGVLMILGVAHVFHHLGVWP